MTARAPRQAISTHAKRHGVHFTPPALAKAVSRTLVRLAGDQIQGLIRISDPACGDGELLSALSTALLNQNPKARIVAIASDLDPDSVSAASIRLAGCCEVVASSDDFLATTAEITRDKGSLFDVQRAADSLPDLLIANPPYVRTQVLGAERAQELARRYGLTGRVDLAYPFVMAMIESLADGGYFAIIVSNKFLTIRAGETLRKYLCEHTQLLELWDLGDSKLFEAAVLPAVIFGRRREGPFDPEKIRVRSLYLETATSGSNTSAVMNEEGLLSAFAATAEQTTLRWNREGWTVRVGSLGVAEGSATWVLHDEATNRVNRTMRSAKIRKWSELLRISVGIKTTADNVFIRADWDALPCDIQPERELLWPVRLTNDCERWSLSDAGTLTHKTLYPFRRDRERRAPIDLHHYPKAAAYFERHSDQLKARRYVIDGGREWFEPWVPHHPRRWMHPRLLWRDIAAVPMFAVDGTNAIPNGTLYWAAPRTDESATDLLWAGAAIANSQWAGSFYDLAIGTRLYAGRRRYNTQALSEFPLPTDDANILELSRFAHLANEAACSGDSTGVVQIEHDLERYCTLLFQSV